MRSDINLQEITEQCIRQALIDWSCRPRPIKEEWGNAAKYVLKIMHQVGLVITKNESNNPISTTINDITPVEPATSADDNASSLVHQRMQPNCSDVAPTDSAGVVKRLALLRTERDMAVERSMHLLKQAQAFESKFRHSELVKTTLLYRVGELTNTIERIEHAHQEDRNTFERRRTAWIKYAATPSNAAATASNLPIPATAYDEVVAWHIDEKCHMCIMKSGMIWEWSSTTLKWNSVFCPIPGTSAAKEAGHE